MNTKIGTTNNVAWAAKMGNGIEVTINRRTYCVAPVDAPALVAALSTMILDRLAPEATTGDGPRWPMPPGAAEFLGRAERWGVDVWRDGDGDGVIAKIDRGERVWSRYDLARDVRPEIEEALALLDAHVAKSTGPRWPMPEFATAWLGRAGTKGVDYDVWLLEGDALAFCWDVRSAESYQLGEVRDLAGEGSAFHQRVLALLDVANRRRATLEWSIARLAELRAAKVTGPRWPKPSSICYDVDAFVGQVDYPNGTADVWSTKCGTGVVIYQGERKTYSWPIDTVKDRGEPWCRKAVSLLAATSKPKRVGYRVRIAGYMSDSDVWASDDVRASFAWEVALDKPKPIARAEAINLIKRCRQWAEQAGTFGKRLEFHLMRVTANGADDV